MPSGTKLVFASRFLLQFIQQVGHDPFPGAQRLADDYPALVVSPVLRVESEQWIVGIARAAIGTGAGVDGFLVIRDGVIIPLLFLVGIAALAVGVGQAGLAQFSIQRHHLRVGVD